MKRRVQMERYIDVPFTKETAAELKAGDLRKFEAASADSGTGGGARDQRFSPGGTFAPVFSKIFPSATPRQRTEWGGKKKVSNVHAADVFVHIDDTAIDRAATELEVRSVDGEDYVVMRMEYWPPTKARPTEVRLGRVAALRLTPPTNEGRVFLLVIQSDAQVSPRLAFITEQAIQNNLWNAEVTDFFRPILAQPPGTNATMGFKDFEAKTSFVK